MTAQELLQRCVDKDTTAWDEFVRRYDGLVTRSVKYKLNKFDKYLSKSETRDIVQEIFLLIWEKDKLAGVKNTACLKSWLTIVSINFTSSYCRKNIFKTAKNTFSMDGNPSPEMPEITLGSMIPSSELNTAKILESNELSGIFNKEISKLEYRQQLMLKFSIYEGKSQKDIAQIMNIPMGTVATLTSQAKKRIRKRLEEVLDV